MDCVLCQLVKKKVIGLMKDELGSEIMRELVALRPKMYTYKVENREFKRCKGVKKWVVKGSIRFEDYKKGLMTGEMQYRSQMVFRSRLHRISTIESKTLALSNEDDKRIYVDEKDSLAIGHWTTRTNCKRVWKVVRS